MMLSQLLIKNRIYRSLGPSGGEFSATCWSESLASVCVVCRPHVTRCEILVGTPRCSLVVAQLPSGTPALTISGTNESATDNPFS